MVTVQTQLIHDRENTKRYLSVLFFNLLLLTSVFSQDIHFSQFYTLPVMISPAFTGLIENTNYRLGTIYKQQWNNIDNAYRTFAASYDMSLFREKTTKGSLGAGGYFFNDITGTSKLSTSQMLLSLAYHLKTNENNTVSFAIQGGFAQKSIRLSELKWDNQFNVDHYDPTLPTGQNNLSQSFLYADFSSGIMWTLNTSNNFNSVGGLAVSHINKPRQSFYNNEKDQLPCKITTHWNGIIKFKNKNHSLEPHILFMQQGTHREVITGGMIKYLIGLNSKYTGINVASSIRFGAFYRWADALILAANFNYKHSLSFGLSYDINVSELYPATMGRGGMELSLIWSK